MNKEIAQAAHELRRLGHRNHGRWTGDVTCPTCRECDHSQKMFCSLCGLGSTQDLQADVRLSWLDSLADRFAPAKDLTGWIVS